MSYSREQIEACQSPEELTAVLAEGQSSPRWTVATLSEVAEFFGLSTQTVKAWRTENPACPGSAPEGWPLDRIVAWRHARLTNSDLATAKKVQDLALGKVELESKELELSKELGELLDRGDVERWAAVALVEARESLMALVELLAVSSPPALRDFVRSETDRHVRATLTALRRRLESDELDKETTTGAADGDDSDPTNEETSDDRNSQK